MTVQLSPTPVQQFLDNAGNPAYLGKLWTYAAGTVIPQTTWVDATQTAQNTNPIVLNTRGECNLWLDQTLSYKFILSDALGNQIWSVDNIRGGVGNQSLIPLLSNFYTVGSPTNTYANIYLGPSGVGLLDPNTGNILFYAQTARENLAGVIPSNYFYPPGNVLRYGADPTGTASSLQAFTSAYNAAVVQAPHTAIHIPAGTYRIPNPGLNWTTQNDLQVYGDGPDLTLITGDTSSYTILTCSADIGLGTTGLNLNLSNFKILNNPLAAGQNGLLVADYGSATLTNLEIYASGIALAMKGMANFTCTNLNLLTWNSNAAGNTALALGTDTHGQVNGPGLFNGCVFNGQGAVTSGAAVTSVGTFSTVFHGCMFIGVGSSLQTVCEFQNLDDITIIGGYSEGSCNTGANTATLFELGRTAACLNFTLIGGHWFSGNGTSELANAIHSVNLGPTTVIGATFANMAAGAISYSIGSTTSLGIFNVSAPGGLAKVFNPGVTGAPTTTSVPYWVFPALQSGYGTITGAAVISGFQGAGGTYTNAQLAGMISALAQVMTTAGWLNT